MRWNRRASGVVGLTAWPPRDRFWLKLALAFPPTIVTLLALFLEQSVRHDRIVFASLASSAFLIYQDPANPMNGVRVMVVGHLVGFATGLAAAAAVGPGFPASAIAMIATIVLLILFGLVHPPAVATALAFAFPGGQLGNAVTFLVVLALLALLVVVQRLLMVAIGAMAPRGQLPAPGMDLPERPR